MSKRYPKVDIVNMTTADREYSYTFPKDMKAFFMQTRDGSSFKYSFKTGDITLDKFITAHQGMAKMEDGTNREDPTTIYFSSSEDGIVMEVEFWR